VPDRSSDEQFAAHPGRFITLGRAMMASGKGDKAVALVEQALERNPEDPLLRCCAEAILTHKVPGFHRDMLADDDRNRAYRAAIEGTGLAGKRVLDIGAGSGLLAMMAARAGARRVYACEANEALAATAREIVAANGFADTIQVLVSHSTKLDAHRDLDGGVDFIVSEIFSHELIGEGALASLHHAATRLAKPGARILPARASIRVALAELREGPAPRIERVEGFDLGPFNRHAGRTRLVATNSEKLAQRSAAQDLFRFDFQAAADHSERRSRVLLESSGGPANGVVQWIRLELTDHVSYENVPGRGESSHWPAVFHPFEDALSPIAQGSIAVAGWHDESKLLIWMDR
jgi:SAM-dependent methyltransferase